MSTYNHAPYVAQSVQSVLDQTFPDFEFLIVDDGSRDDTPRIVAQFDDPRISFAAASDNRGSAARRSELIERSRGKYIAVQNSDDYWPPDKLAYQRDFLESNPAIGAVFGGACVIDASGAPITDMKPVFDHDNRSPGQWLRRFFERGNCLCHPSVMIRRSCHEELGGYDRRFRQSLDLQMWVRFCKKFRLFQSDKVLVFLRWHGKNVSNIADDPDAHVRWFNEHYLIAYEFFDDMSKELLVEGFRDLLVFGDPPTDAHCDVEKALIYLKPDAPFAPLYRAFGLKRLYDLLGSSRHRAILATDYHIDHLAFQRLSAEIDTYCHLHEEFVRRDDHIGALQREIVRQEARIARLERRSPRMLVRRLGAALRRAGRPAGGGTQPARPPD
jgi:glycosyltransferase involved in cell wall biosynthesis